MAARHRTGQGALLIRGFGVRVPGGAPVQTCGFVLRGKVRRVVSDDPTSRNLHGASLTTHVDRMGQRSTRTVARSRAAAGSACGTAKTGKTSPRTTAENIVC
jgi:hypothetical protein